MIQRSMVGGLHMCICNHRFNAAFSPYITRQGRNSLYICRIQKRPPAAGGAALELLDDDPSAGTLDNGAASSPSQKKLEGLRQWN